MAEEELNKRAFKEVLADISAKSAEKREKEAKAFKFREEKRAKDLKDATEKQTKQAAKDAEDIKKINEEMSKFYKKGTTELRKNISEDNKKIIETLDGQKKSIEANAEFAQQNIERLSVAETQAKEYRSQEVQDLDLQKEALAETKRILEGQGKIAEDDKKYKAESLRIQREEFAIQRKGNISRSAKEEIDKKERAAMMEQGTLLQKISAGIGGINLGLKDKAKKVGKGLFQILKGTLFAGLFFALAGFLQSPLFQQTIDYIFDVAIPALIEFSKDLMKFVKAFIDVGKRVVNAFVETGNDLTEFLKDPSWNNFTEIFTGDSGILLSLTALSTLFLPFGIGRFLRGKLYLGAKSFVGMFGKNGKITRGVSSLFGVLNGGQGGPKGKQLDLFGDMAKKKGGLFTKLKGFAKFFGKRGALIGAITALTAFTAGMTTDLDNLKKKAGVPDTDAKKKADADAARKKKAQMDLFKKADAQSIENQKKFEADKLNKAKKVTPVNTKVGGNLTKEVAELTSKSVTRGIMKKSVLLSIPAGLYFGFQRALAGEYALAAMEVASGVVGVVPGKGTLASTAIDSAIFATDLSNITGGTTKLTPEQIIQNNLNEIENIKSRFTNNRHDAGRLNKIEQLKEENIRLNEVIQKNALDKSGANNGGSPTIIQDNSKKDYSDQSSGKGSFFMAPGLIGDPDSSIRLLKVN